jgi:hypothetical protein
MPFGMNRRTIAPASGRKRISERRGKPAAFVTVYLTSR